MPDNSRKEILQPSTDAQLKAFQIREGRGQPGAGRGAVVGTHTDEL